MKKMYNQIATFFSILTVKMLCRGGVFQWEVFSLMTFVSFSTTGHVYPLNEEVCGTDGYTYKNEEELKSAQSHQPGLLILHKGPCLNFTRLLLPESSKFEDEKYYNMYESYGKSQESGFKTVHLTPHSENAELKNANILILLKESGRRLAKRTGNNLRSSASNLRWVQQNPYKQQYINPYQSSYPTPRTVLQGPIQQPPVAYPLSPAYYQSPSDGIYPPQSVPYSYFTTYNSEYNNQMNGMPPPPPTGYYGSYNTGNFNYYPCQCKENFDPNDSIKDDSQKGTKPGGNYEETDSIKYDPSLDSEGSGSNPTEPNKEIPSDPNGPSGLETSTDTSQKISDLNHQGDLIHKESGNLGNNTESDENIEGSDEDILEGNLSGEVSTNFGGTFQGNMGGSKGLSLTGNAKGKVDAKLGTSFATQGDNVGGTLGGKVSGNVGGNFAGTMGGKEEKDFEGDITKGRFSGTFGADFTGKFGGSFGGKVKGGKKKDSKMYETNKRSIDRKFEGYLQSPSYPVVVVDESIDDVPIVYDVDRVLPCLLDNEFLCRSHLNSYEVSLK